jgi:hypothetical protein
MRRARQALPVPGLGRRAVLAALAAEAVHDLGKPSESSEVPGPLLSEFLLSEFISPGGVSPL